MQRIRFGGACLVIGPILGLFTMLLHPTGHDIQVNATVMSAVNAIVHLNAILAAPIVTYGAWALTKHLSRDGDRPVAELALMFLGLAELLVTIAAIADGLLAPYLIQAQQAAVDVQLGIQTAVLRYNTAVNQSFALVYVIASCVAFLLWSVQAIRSARLSRALGIFGCVVMPVLLFLVTLGHMHLNIHGFGLVVLLQGAWMVWAGVELRNLESLRPPVV